ncbi:hypothetical protein FRB99_001972 [Tulasnella sp. 403]|nr:hypothetical protein FRB99_001972 [Tulasnella sp. 403]
MEQRAAYSDPHSYSTLATSISRLRKWSFSRSKDKKALDQHFVRTRSGRWVKAEHPLISTDDEDDEARRRREQRAEASGLDSDDPSPFEAHHEQRASLEYDPQVNGPLIPPWHTSKQQGRWEGYSSHPSDQSSSSYQAAHSHSQSATAIFDSQPSSETTATSTAISVKQHTPPAPIPFPTPNYVPTPSRHHHEERRGRIKYKPGSLYPMHNPVKPPQPYTNWHLCPPDLDLPPIFTPAGYCGVGGGGAKGTSTPGTDGAGQTASANGSVSATGSSQATKETPTRDNSRDGRPTLQPPAQGINFQQATSAILGHSTSHQSLNKVAVAQSGSQINPDVTNAIPARSNSEMALAPKGLTNTTQPHAPPPAHLSRSDSVNLDLNDPWGAGWSHASPYDLGRTPLSRVKIPKPQPNSGNHPTSPPTTGTFNGLRRTAPSPLGGLRHRRPSQDPPELAARPSQDRERSVDPSPSPPSPKPEKERTLFKKLSNTGYTSEDGDDRKGKRHGLRALFTGSSGQLAASAADGRPRKRTISLGQAGLGVGLPLLGHGASISRTRKPSFEVIRKPSTRPSTAPTGDQGAGATSESRGGEPDAADNGHPAILPDRELVTSPVDGTPIPFPSQQDDGMLSTRPSVDLHRSASDIRNGRSSRELARTPSLTRPMISQPMPLKRSPSTCSVTSTSGPAPANVLNVKKSTSHLGHGVLEGIGLGRRPSLTNATPPTIAPPQQRGRKISKTKGPPRTLHRYAQSIEQFDALYSKHSNASYDSAYSSDQEKQGSGGVVGKLVKKLSWITKSAKDREREAQVEEQMRQYARERALDRRLEEARARADAEGTDSGVSRNGSGHIRNGAMDERRVENLAEPEEPARRSEAVDVPKRAVTPETKPPPVHRSPGSFDSDNSDIQAALKLVTDKPEPVDPRSPAQGIRRAFFKPSNPNLLASPAQSNDQPITPFGKLAASFLSPLKKSTSQNNLNSSAPALTSTNSGNSGVEPLSRHPSRGPSPVPPRPPTPPERQESPRSLPRMALTIMNPDSPSPPTPTRELSPEPMDLDPPAHTVTPTKSVAKPDRNGFRRNTRQVITTPPKDPAVLERQLVLASRSMVTSPAGDSTESETDDQRDQRGLMMSPSVMSPVMFQRENAPGYGQYQMVHVSYANGAGAMVVAGPQMQQPRPESHMPFYSPDTQFQVVSPLDHHRSLPAGTTISYAVAPPEMSPETIHGYAQQASMMVQSAMVNGMAVMMVQPQQQPHASMPARTNPVPPPPQIFPSPFVPKLTDDSSESQSSEPESKHAPPQLNYEPAPPPRPNLPNQSASDPLPTRQEDLEHRPSSGRRETISAFGKQYELVVEDKGRESLDGKHRRNGSGSKTHRRTSSKQHSDLYGNVVEELRGLGGYDGEREKRASRDREREREREREWAREYWDRVREEEQRNQALAAKEKRRKEREATKEMERQRLKEIEREDYERERERRERHERHLARLGRSSTITTVPPTPPPKHDIIKPAAPLSHSSSSSSGNGPSRHHHSRHHSSKHQSPTADSSSSQDPPPQKSSKVSRTSSSRPSDHHHRSVPKHILENKPLPRPVSEAPAAETGAKVHSKESVSKSTRHSTDRAERGKTKTMPVPPALNIDKDQYGSYRPEDRRSSMSPTGQRGRTSLGSPNVGSGFTSFSVQSPYSPSSRPHLGYVPAPPPGKHNPMPRPPRDISLDIPL